MQERLRENVQNNFGVLGVGAGVGVLGTETDFWASTCTNKERLTACIQEHKASVCTRHKGLPCLDQVCGKLGCLACGALAQLVHHNTNLRGLVGA